MNSENKLIPQYRFPEFKNNLWKEKKMGDLFHFVRGPFGGALKKEIFTNEGYAVYEQSHAIYNNFSDYRYYITRDKYNELIRFSVKPQDLLMSCSGTMGKFSIVPENYKRGVINQALLKLTVKANNNVHFLKYLLETDLYQHKLLSQSAGGAIKNVVGVSEIKEIATIIPELKEQQKIAACLSSLDDVITGHQEKLTALEEHKKGLIQNLFPQEGETQPKYRFPEFENDGDWDVVPFRKYISLFRGSSPRPIVDFQTTDKDAVNWIKIGDTKNAIGYILKNTEERITHEGAKRSRAVAIGEIILANSMSYGKAYILELDGCIYDGWFVLRNFEEYFDKNYLIQLLNSDYLQNQYKKLAAGGIVQNISSEIVYNTKLFHTDIKEQQKIASVLSSVDRLIVVQRGKIEALKEHKKGLMQGLFPKIES